MTSGNKTIDNRSLVSALGSDCLNPVVYSNLRVGEYTSKIWNGGDSTYAGKRPFTYRIFSYPIFGSVGSIVSYRTRRRKVYTQGVRPPRTENAYSMTLTKSRDQVYRTVNNNIVCTSGRKVTGCASTEGFSFLDGPNSLWTSNDDISLIGKLSDKISGDGFNMLVFLGEGKEALETTARAATRIYRSLRALRKGNVSKAVKELVGAGKPAKTKIHPNASGKAVSDDWISSRWLELQYGWKPLVQDIYSAMSHFAYMQNRPQILTYRTGKVVRRQTLVSASSSYKIVGAASHGKRIKAIVTKIDEIALLGLTDPASLLWEKLPWSFVVDWVIPIGNYLDAINLNRALSAKYVISSHFIASATGASPTANGISYIDAVFEHKVVVSSRTISTSLPIPLPRVKPWDKIASWGHAANAVALLSGLFKPSRSKTTTQLITEGGALKDEYERSKAGH